MGFQVSEGQPPSWEPPPCPTLALGDPTAALGGTSQAQLKAGLVKSGTPLDLRITLEEQERAGLAGTSWRHAGTDGRSTAEPGRPGLLFQQGRAGAGVPPDFPPQAPGLRLRELQRGLPARSPGGARCQGSRGRCTNAPGHQAGRGSPGGRRLLSFLPRTAWGRNAPLCPCLPSPLSKPRGAPKAHKEGHPEHQDDPQGAFQGALSPKILQKCLSQLFFLLFFSGLSQVFKTLWTFPCHSTSLGKWEGRKEYRGSHN